MQRTFGRYRRSRWWEATTHSGPGWKHSLGCGRPYSVIIDGATHSGVRGILARPETLAALRDFLSTGRSKR